LSDLQTVFLQINTVKYDVDREITNIYENLQIVRSHFFTNIVLSVNIRSTSNIYWFIGDVLLRIILFQQTYLCKYYNNDHDIGIT
jgi:hypothetical protein